ncbi:MAG: ATP-dependent 6-phosphofructokinase [Alphaproteobacteria bacterium]|jgi:6-phosphofructokinase 1|nr:ATP-dependent 6-phosphofructokinase [Alphaproteobacteria bacterium]MDP6516145.1 ATP-dependent 6-phosphofructokinase [Alphaproteobacteria bacterium]
MRIGILTSGGDCAGLNAVIRAVVNRAVRKHGWQVIGINQGTDGLIARPVRAMPLDFDSVPGNIMMMSGTILGTTSRGDPFALADSSGTVTDYSDAIIKGYHELGLEALIGIGGDGSLSILSRLAAKGDWNLVAIPKTIDNDVGLTETAIGFGTAVQVATEALDRLHFTAASHDRVMILEVMGRDAGHIALHAGIAGAADVILIPEIPYTLEAIRTKIRRRAERGKNYNLIIVAESVKTEAGRPVTMEHGDGRRRYGGVGQYLAARIGEMTRAETRVTVLGHVQRGGIPASSDRLLGSAFGVYAVDLIAAKNFGRMIAWQNRQVIDVAIEDAIASYVSVDPDDALVHTARGLGICLGDDADD